MTNPPQQIRHFALLRLLERIGLFQATTESSPAAVGDRLPIHLLAERGIFDERQAILAVSGELGISSLWIDTETAGVLACLLDCEPCSKVSPLRWREACAVPIEVSATKVQLAVADPLDRGAISALEFSLERRCEFVLANEEGIRQVITLASRKDNRAGISLILRKSEDLEKSELKLPAEFTVTDTHRSTNAIDDPNAAPIVQLANKIISEAVELDSSDIHLTNTKDNLIVRVRVNGLLRTLFEIPKNLAVPLISRCKLLASMDISEKRLPQDGRFQVRTNVGVRDLRISTVPSAYGENLVARILSGSLPRFDFDTLEMPERLQGELKGLLALTSQAILVTGPTGSGKTSTLYACLKALHTGTANIVTLEDPIEYRLEGTTQIQINPKIDLTFAEGLRSVLRQDPDVILLGEIRDEETAQTALQVAQTGHLLLSSLHTNSAPGAVTRLLDLNVPPFVLAATLGGVVAQRLVRRLCDCAKHAAEEEQEIAASLGINPENLKIPKGCPECNYQGFTTRLGIFSVLRVSDSVRNAIRDRASEYEIERLARESGYRSLQEEAIELIAEGKTTIAEVERVLGPIVPTIIEPNPSTRNGIRPAKSIDPHKILLVEDDDDTREILSMVFKEELFEVCQARNGKEGLLALHQELPDLIICDIRMPEMDGLTFINRIRHDNRLRELPVLMLTANGSEESELALMSGGADDYVSKGSHTALLLSRVRRLLERTAKPR